jgi:hypothetical protein
VQAYTRATIPLRLTTLGEQWIPERTATKPITIF